MPMDRQYNFGSKMTENAARERLAALSWFVVQQKQITTGGKDPRRKYCGSGNEPSG